VMDPDETIAQIDAVTSHDMQRVAQACFAPQWRRLAIIGPDDPRRSEYFSSLLQGQ
jgi:predicted Zn-dependent peptidase